MLVVMCVKQEVYISSPAMFYLDHEECDILFPIWIFNFVAVSFTVDILVYNYLFVEIFHVFYIQLASSQWYTNYLIIRKFTWVKLSEGDIAT